MKKVYFFLAILITCAMLFYGCSKKSNMSSFESNIASRTGTVDDKGRLPTLSFASGAKFSAPEDETLQPGVKFTIIEEKVNKIDTPLGELSNVYLYTISAKLYPENTLEGPVSVNTLNKPLNIKLPNNQSDRGVCYIGIRESEEDPWRFQLVTDEIQTIANYIPQRASAQLSPLAPKNVEFNLFRAGVQIALFVLKSIEQSLDIPRVDIVDSSISEKVYTQKGLYFNDINLSTVLKGSKLNDLKSSDVAVKIVFTSDLGNLHTIKANESTYNLVCEDNKAATGGKYAYSFDIDNLKFKEQLGTEIKLDFALNTKKTEVENFPQSFLIETHSVVGSKNPNREKAFIPFTYSQYITFETEEKPEETASDTETITDTETSTASGTETITDTDTASGTQTITDTDTASGTETITDTDTASGTQTITDTDTASGTQTITDTDTASGTQTITDTDTASGTQTITDTDTASGTQTITDTDTASGTQTITDTDTASGTQTITDTETQTGTGSGTGSGTETSTATDTGTQTQTSTDTGTGSGTQTDTGSGTETETQTQTDTGTNTGTDTGTEHIIMYNINYELDGGTPTAENPDKYGIASETITLNPLTRDGCIFKGWTGSNGNIPETLVTIQQGSTGDKTFTANWDYITYTITCNIGEGATVTNPTTYIVSDNVVLNRPTKPGYDFTGWTGSNGEEPQLDVTIPADSTTGDKTYTAHWELHQYTITYILGDGGSTGNPTIYTINTGAIVLTEPIRDGYEFTGWSGTDLTGENNMTVTIPAGASGDREYEAHWNLTGYRITYNLDGGSVNPPNPSAYSNNNQTIALTNPTKRGYTFTGWSGSGIDGDPIVDYSIPQNSTGDLSFVANWSLDSYTITCNLNGGSVATPNATEYTVNSSNITLNNPTRDGYTFQGWTGSNGNTPQTTVTIAQDSVGNKEYNAVWSLITYTITYVDDENTNTTTSYNTESTNINLTNPTKTGYDFTGWSGTDLTGENNMSVTIAQGSIGNRTYTAHWSIQSYNVNITKGTGIATVTGGGSHEYNSTVNVGYTLEDGYEFASWTGDKTVNTFTMPANDVSMQANANVITYTISYILNEGSATNPVTYDVTSEAIILNNPTREGSTFTGWTYEGQSTPQMSVTIPHGSTGNKTFTANWSTASYLVTLNKETGVATVSGNGSHEYLTTVNVSCTMEPGYEFDYWDGDKTVDSFKMPAHDITMTAHARLINYTITCNLAGGELNTPNPETYTVVSNNITLNNPTKDGYTFAGWTGDGSGETVTITNGSTGNKTYTATWTPTEYTITYNDAVGANNPTNYTIETPTITLTAPTKNGYEFTGWSGDGTGMSVTIPQGTTGNKTFTANWSIENYTITYDLHSGSVEGNNPESYNINTTTFTLINPTRIGCEFTGWSGTGLDGNQITVTIEQGSYGERSYEAHWGFVDYTITCNLNGGTLNPTNPATYRINSNNITLNNPTKDGYTFAGWTGSNGEDPQTSVTIEKGSTGNKTYNANWTPKTYTIAYVDDEDTNTTTSYTIESANINLTEPTKDGYDFTGWTLNNEATLLPSVTITTGSTGDRTYTAHWTPKEFTISYDGIEGATTAEVNPTRYYITSNDIILSNPVKDGFTFTGWSGTDVTESNKFHVIIEKGSIGHRYYSANWTKGNYTVTVVGGEGVSAVYGGGNYDFGTTVTVDYTLLPGYEFVSWIGNQTTSVFTMPAENVSMTANARPIAYSISINYNDGSANNPQTYNVTSEDITLNNPTKEGYTFTGWSGDASGMSVSIPHGSSGNKSYTANWTPTEYSITYDMHNGIHNNQTTYTYEDVVTLEMPTREGCRFTGWSGTGLNGNQLSVTIPLGSTGDRNYEAHWSLINYTISYDLNGGVAPTNPSNPDSFTINTSNITLLQPTKFGCNFAGWTGSNGNSPELSVTIAKGSTSNKSYTANWTPITYNLTYELNGGNLAIANPNEYTIETNDFTLNNPTRNGFEFVGWSSDYYVGQLTEVSIRKNTTIGDKSFTASWNPITYNITYVPNGDNVVFDNRNPNSYTVESNDITIVYQPTRIGYDFAGWSSNYYDGNQNNPTLIQGSQFKDIVYTANWNPHVYNINYTLNGGNIVTTKNSYTILSSSFELDEPNRPGYRFTGWTGSNGGTPNTSVTITQGTTGDLTYIANWSPEEYTITFNGGGVHSNQGTYNIETETFSLTDASRDYYTFTGWTGEGIITPTKGITITNGTIGNKTYTANWTPIEYTIMLIPSAVDVTLNNEAIIDYNVESNPINLNEPSRNYYIFTGWTGTGLDGLTKPLTIPQGSHDNKTYTANWEPTPYSITYNGGGTHSNPTTYDVTTPTFSLSDANRGEAYTFTGWTGEGYDTPTKSISIPIGSHDNKTYTANWNPVTYTISYLGTEGATGSNPTNYNIESVSFTLNDLNKSGYTFLGWTGEGYDSPTKSIPIDLGSFGHRTYTANWQINGHQVTLNKGTGIATVTGDGMHDYNSTVTASATTLAGYQFDSWSGYTTNETFTMPDSDVTMTANATPITYTISCELDGGTLNYTNEYNVESTSFTIGKPKKGGYNFTGWSGTGLVGSNNMTITIPQGSYGNKVYTAHWELRSYNINYNLGEGAVNHGSNPSTFTIQTNQALEAPTRNGYTFDGWSGKYDSNDQDIFDGVSPTVTIPLNSTGNRTYTAHWTPIVYTIKYAKNGGEFNSAAPTTYTVEDTVTLPSLTRAGYTFVGYYELDPSTDAHLSENLPEVTWSPGEKTGNKKYEAHFWSNP